MNRISLSKGSKITRVSLAALMVLTMAVIFGVSCESRDPTPSPALVPASSPEREPTTELAPPTDWSPDGLISPGEYNNMKAYGKYEIHWSNDEGNIYLGIRAQTSGWVAVGIQPRQRMKDADIVFGFVQDGETFVYDLYSIGDFGPHSKDTELGGTNDIADFGGKEEGEYTTIEFKRALETGDKYDNRLSSGTNKIIWSFGSGDEMKLKHSSRGYGQLDL